jgi:GNAT superfamily N-acetyltransferase
MGDSIAAGIGDPVDGYADQAWADRLVAALGADYLNLGRPGAQVIDVRAGQLDQALAFGPDLAVVAAGANDAFRRSFAAPAVAGDAMLAFLRKLSPHTSYSGSSRPHPPQTSSTYTSCWLPTHAGAPSSPSTTARSWGHAQAIASPDHRTVELGVVIVDDWQGNGIGPRLLHALLETGAAAAHRLDLHPPLEQARSAAGQRPVDRRGRRP